MLGRGDFGFSMMEIMLVVVLLTVLVTGIIVAINPGDQFARGRNTERIADLRDFHDAISQKVTSEGLEWHCESGDIPSELNEGVPVPVEIGNGPGQYDLCQCLTPEYMYTFPVDPLEGAIDNPNTCEGSYSSGYEIWRNPENNRTVIRAPHAERGETIGINLEELESN